MRPLQFLLTAAIAAVVAFAVSLFVVFATGQTFGQRCAAHFADGSPEWRACVSRLAGGRKP